MFKFLHFLVSCGLISGTILTTLVHSFLVSEGVCNTRLGIDCFAMLTGLTKPRQSITIILTEQYDCAHAYRNDHVTITGLVSVHLALFCSQFSVHKDKYQVL